MYNDEELKIDPDAGNTDECPFDCSCTSITEYCHASAHADPGVRLLLSIMEARASGIKLVIPNAVSSIPG